MRLLHVLFAAASIGTALLNARDAAGQTPLTVHVGDAVVDGTRIPLGKSAMRGMRRDSANAEARQVGSSQDELSATTANGRPALLRVLTINEGTGVRLDSVLYDRATLAPIWRHQRTPQRIVLLEFNGTGVRGSIQQSSGTDSITYQGTERMFEDLTSDLVLAALPLKVGDRYRVPVYARTEGGLVWMDVLVETAPPMPGSTNVLALVISRGRLNTRWFVDAATRKQLGSVSALPNGGEMRVTLQQ